MRSASPLSPSPPPFSTPTLQEWNGLREITEKTFKFESYEISVLLFTAASFGLFYGLVKSELEDCAHPRGTCVKGVRKLGNEPTYAGRTTTWTPLVKGPAKEDRPAAMARPAL